MDRKIKILIAEDEPVILRSVKRGIESFGDPFQVSAIAYDGSEALQMMEKEDYDIVITDIVMPLMDGLEMMNEVRNRGLRTKFILLSGYDRFEFAQKAIEIGVVKYLLKPVDFEELRKCLEELREEIYKNKREEEKRYLQELSGNYQVRKEFRKKGFYYIIVVIHGCLVRSDLEKKALEPEEDSTVGESFLEGLEEKYKRSIYEVRGHYHNEKLLIASVETPQWSGISQLAGDVYEKLRSKNTVSVCYNRQGIPGEGISKQLAEMHCEIPLCLIFGKSSLWCYSGKEMSLNYIVGDGVRNAVNRINIAVTEGEIDGIIGKCVTGWEKRNLTQYQLQAELRYLLEHLSEEQSIDIMGILNGVYLYEDLKKELTKEILQIIRLEMRRKADKGSLLADAVKAYLDLHFAEEIVYKEFNQIFGYNEKYITTVFKEKLGISPSRYVVERRMEKAKELLINNRSLLLKEVAEEVGYTDPLYFSKVFKNYAGVSPSTYAKLKRDTGE